MVSFFFLNLIFLFLGQKRGFFLFPLKSSFYKFPQKGIISRHHEPREGVLFLLRSVLIDGRHQTNHQLYWVFRKYGTIPCSIEIRENQNQKTLHESTHFIAYSVTHMCFVYHHFSYHIQSTEHSLNPRTDQWASRITCSTDSGTAVYHGVARITKPLTYI